MNLKFWGDGTTDLPRDANEEDLLGISDYAKGMAGFITRCPTPMSIAIQGDWGTGKTSVINYVRKELGGKVTSVYFNTWQYAQFNMSDNLYFSFLTSLLKEMGAGDGEGFKKIKQTLLTVASMASNVFLGGNGVGKEDLEKLVQSREDAAESVAELKNAFAAEVHKCLGSDPDKRLVIFVDDLDRLNPNVAVELLEVMKLFMDVKGCVFVLAIDYGVVVQGVRQKFGQDISLAKCRSFFDKIIQLPFHMPVESYHLEKMMKTQLPGIEEGYVQPLAAFAKHAIGANPRTFKRLCNSFLLIQSVKAAQTAQEKGELSALDRAMLFCALCVQMNCPELHGYLASSEQWYELGGEKALLEKAPPELTGGDVEEFLGHSFEKNAEVDWDELADLLVELDATLRQLEADPKKARAAFTGVLKISGITSVTAQKQSRQRADATKVTGVEVLGKSQAVNKASQAMKFTFQTVLESHPGQLDSCIAQLNILSWTERRDSVFRSRVPLTLDGKTLHLGTSTSTADKLKSLDRLGELCGLNPGDIRWLDGDACIYEYPSR